MILKISPALFVVIALCGPSVLAGYRCDRIHQSQIVVFDYQAIEVSRDLPEVRLVRFGIDDGGASEGIRLLDKDSGKDIGYVEYYYFPKERVLDVNFIKIRTDFRGQGAGAALFSAIHQTSKQADAVEAILALDNFRTFQREVSRGASFVDAVKATAFYRQNARHGFTEVEILSRGQRSEILQAKQIQISLWKLGKNPELAPKPRPELFIVD